jgi:glycine/D-amino acid oxidase-like deaminating enzyme
MDIRSNEPFWLIKNPLIKSYPSLKHNIETPVVIIGGGITGALIAFKLISEKYKVVLIDRRDVCNGSSAASTAMLQYEIDTPLHELIDKVGLTNAVSSYQNCEKAIFGLEKIAKTIKSKCNFERKESVYFTTNKKDISFLTKEFEARKTHGFDVTWLDKNDLKKMGINRGMGAIKSASGAVMDPYILAQELLKYSSEKGLTVFDRTEIKSFKYTDSNILLTTKDNKTINCQHVIHCTGYESVHTLSKDIVSLKSTYAYITESYKELPDAFKNMIFWDTSSPYLYFRGTNDNRIIMGGGDEDFKNANARDRLIEKKKKQISKQFKSIFPKIDFTIDYGWAGTFGETKDGLPYIGSPNADKNEYYVLGFGGNGITFSIMGMDAIIPALEKTPHPHLEYYKFDR